MGMGDWLLAIMLFEMFYYEIGLDWMGWVGVMGGRARIVLYRLGMGLHSGMA